jgi:di/tricarboxylate transporter
MEGVGGGGILVIEAEPKAMASALSGLGLVLEEDVRKKTKDKAAGGKNDTADNTGVSVQSDEIVLMELVVLPNSAVAGRSATAICLRTRFGINLLAVSRQGRRSTARLRTMAIREGDVLLMQGNPESLGDFAAQFGCVPLAERRLRLPDARSALIPAGTLVVAVGCAAFDLLPTAVAFALGALLAVVFRVVQPRRVYAAIDWTVTVLRGALLPVAEAIATTGTATLLAGLLLDAVSEDHAVVALTVILVVTMMLSAFLNNAATAALMCPIAIGAADRLVVSADSFLTAVAVGASCAFLTPISHQNNTLILGPSGLRFGDYWRLGLPLEILVIAVGVPMIAVIWPF